MKAIAIVVNAELGFRPQHKYLFAKTYELTWAVDKL